MNNVDDCTLRGSVEITVFRGDRILAVNSRNFDGFCGVGGKVEPGESFEQAARRELMEETGCEARSIQFVAGHTLDPIKGDDATVRWYCAGFVVDIGDQWPRSVEAGTTPFWTTKEEMIQNSLFPEWYAWWFGILERTDPNICWHCHVVLAEPLRPRCERCPDECDAENCDEPGCGPQG